MCRWRAACAVSLAGHRRLNMREHFVMDPLQRVLVREDLCSPSLAFAEQAEQDVLGADVVVLELQRLAQRQLEHLLRPRGERDVPAG